MVAFGIKVASVIISKLLGVTILDLYFKPWNLTGNDADIYGTMLLHKTKSILGLKRRGYVFIMNLGT